MEAEAPEFVIDHASEERQTQYFRFRPNSANSCKSGRCRLMGFDGIVNAEGFFDQEQQPHQHGPEAEPE